MVMQKELQDTLEHALNCVLCFCGNYKRMGKPFCFRCFDSLPHHWQGVMRNASIIHEPCRLLTSEIEPIDGEVHGDFEGAYDIMIGVARAALEE